MPASIQVEGLRKRFGNTVAIQGLSMEIGEGEFVSLLGPSGCGKTTVLRCLAGLETPDAGTIHMDGQLVFSASRGLSVPPGRRGIGMVFQSYALWPHLSVAANVSFGLEVLGVARDEQRRRVDSVLRLVGIEDLASRFPSELSGGQQQRVALARAIVTQPRILLLDEPLSNLDAKLRLQMRAELQRLHRQLGCTVVYVTHDQMEAMTLSNRIVLLRQGVLQQAGAPREIYRRPANVWVADFVGSPGVNLLAGTVLSGGRDLKLDCGLTVRLAWRSLQPEEKVWLGLRPEDLRPGDEPGFLSLSGLVHSVQPAGNETLVQVRLGAGSGPGSGGPARGSDPGPGPSPDVVTVRVFGEVDWSLDREVRLCIDERKVLVFSADSGRLLSGYEDLGDAEG